jgi:hypothetical protein
VAYVQVTRRGESHPVVFCETDANQFSGRRFEEEVVVNSTLLGEVPAPTPLNSHRATLFLPGIADPDTLVESSGNG